MSGCLTSVGRLCGVPSGRGEWWGGGSQGCTLGWYALPRWGKGLAVSDPCLEGCGLGAKCGNRGRRTRFQWRRRRLDGGFGSGFFVAGVADPGAARSVKRYRIRWSRRAPHRTSLRERAESETPTFSSDWRLNEWVSHKRFLHPPAGSRAQGAGCPGRRAGTGRFRRLVAPHLTPARPSAQE